MTDPDVVPPLEETPTNWFGRIRRRVREKWLYKRAQRIEGRPVVSLDSVLGPFDPRFQSRVLMPLAALKDQYLEGQRYLVPDDWRVCRERIEEGIRTASALADEMSRPTGDKPDPVETFLAGRALEVASEIKTRAQRRVQREYFKGTIIGVFASIVLLVVLYLVIKGCLVLFSDGLHGDKKTLVEHALVAVAGGAGGATLSSLIRLRKQEIEDHHASGFRAAAIRIMLGWFFAATILFMAKGELFTLFKVPAAPLAQWFYWGGLGFFAGFNEAWVTDLVTKKTADGAKEAAKKVTDELKEFAKR
ncbi:hypothetical protein AB0M43_29280 [Longispora sp. NPDC051575]|uniref:hypothetical protein n=1 Tax=Longispora sp. NPDC051575 TaxID=3154943 RepID=UPI00341F9EB5